MDKKIVADDALISTDIDSLIKYLSSKKRVEINTLARELRTKVEVVRKWVAILEEEGYVKVEYKLLNEFVIWAGEESATQQPTAEVPQAPAKKEEAYAQPEYPKKAEAPAEAPKPKTEFLIETRQDTRIPQEPIELIAKKPEQRVSDEKPPAIERAGAAPVSWTRKEEINAPKQAEKAESKPLSPAKEEDLFKPMIPIQDDFTASERVDRILERIGKADEGRKQKPPSQDRELTKGIISSFSEERSDQDLEHEDKILEETFAASKKRQQPHKKEEAEKPQLISRVEKEAVEKAAAAKAERQRSDDEMVSLKKSLAQYMDEIGSQKSTIEKLKAERERLLAESYLPLETRFKSAYESIAEKLLEKEGKLIEMKERVLELPGKIGEASKLEAALGRIRQEGRHAVTANREEMDKLKKSLREEDERLRNEISSIAEELKGRRTEIVDIAKSMGDLSDREQGIKREMEELNKSLAEVNETVASAYGSMAQISQNRAELTRRLENIRIALEARSNEASESYSRLRDVRKAESVINEYISDYQKKISEIEDYAKESEKDLSKLKEFAEVKYIRGYLKELENISATYEQELENVNAQEKGIDERIEGAKDRLNQLLRESRELVKSLEKKTSGKDFEKLVYEVRSKQEAVSSSLNERAAQSAEHAAAGRAAMQQKKPEVSAAARKAAAAKAKEKDRKGKKKKK